MKVKVGDERYEFDETRLLVEEAREIKRHTGMGLRAFSQGLQEGDVDSIVAMLYLCKRRSGEAVQWTDFNTLNLATLDMSGDEPPADEQGADEPDPTTPAEVVAPAPEVLPEPAVVGA